MTGMDVLEFRDINGEDPMPKYGAKENLQFDFSLALFKLFQKMVQSWVTNRVVKEHFSSKANKTGPEFDTAQPQLVYLFLLRNRGGNEEQWQYSIYMLPSQMAYNKKWVLVV